MNALPVLDLALPAVPAAEQIFLASPARPGGFTNPWGVRVEKGPADLLRWQLASNPFRAARQQPPRMRLAPDPVGAWRQLADGTRLLWLGHATVLVEVDGVAVLIDPVFGRAALAPRAMPMPLPLDQLPEIHAVVITHGHYDHLDAPSLRALARRFGPDLPVVLPSGLGSSLPRACRNVTELSWWQAVELRGVRINLVPAQHWHRRGAFDLDRSLWGGVVIEGSHSVYHSGDTGWFDGFRTIGRVFPDLDIAILPLGAYEPRWFMSQQHMSPEHSVQALAALGARHLVGMHWGTFDLTDEPLDHGAFELLPAAVEAADLDPERFLVLAHGGAVGLPAGAVGPSLNLLGAAGVPGLAQERAPG